MVVGRARRLGSKWLCHCDCGKTTISDSYQLRHGITKSCGCYQRDGARRIRIMDGCQAAKNAMGYRMIFARSHPAASKRGGLVLEHRLIMEQYLGRYLK